MDDLLELARRLVAQARPGEQVEAFLTHEREFSVKTYDGEVESLSSAEPRGVGVRLIRDGGVGFAYSTAFGPEQEIELVGQARANSKNATPDSAAGLADAWKAPPADIAGLIDESQPEVGPDEKVAFALRLERATRAVDARIKTVEEAVYSDSDTRVAIATSTGVEGTYRRTDAWCYSFAIAHEGHDTQVGFDFSLARGLSGLDADDVASRAARRALGVLGASKIASARMPVVFDPYTAAQFVGVLGNALTGEAVQKGRSLFAGRLGERVAARGLSLVDDGTRSDAPGSSPWDAEGVPTQRTEVIRDGVLTSFLYDLTSARRDATTSTGNASRAGFKSVPGPAPSNMAFETTGESRDDVFQLAGRALWVQDLHGVHSGANPISGDFSVGVTGRLLEDGALGEPVSEVTIAAPMTEMLARTVAVATDRRWLPFGGSYGGATTLVSEMTIAGL